MKILGCRLDPIDRSEATRRILDFARNGTAAQIVTLGTEMVVYAQRDAAYRELIDRAALCLCDTIGLLKAAQAQGAPLRERVPGADLIHDLCEGAARDGLSVYLLGAAPGIAQRAAAELQRLHPGLRVAGVRDGYFAPGENAAVAAAIRESGARLLFAALGFPKQEFWIAQYLPQTGCGAAIGVGGTFDVLAGAVERAPERWRALGLEWLYRLIKEPRRWRRQLALPQFVLLLALDGVRSRLAKGRT